jgi:hypothetical protein
MKWESWMIALYASTLLSGCGTSRQAVGLEYRQIAETIRWGNNQELDSTPTPIGGQIVRENEKYEKFGMK